MTVWVIAASVAVGIAAHGAACAQNAAGAGSSPPPNSIVLVASTGKVAARPLNDTVMLITISSGVAAPALIRPIYDGDGRTASGLATWQSGGSVLFTSSDCTTGAYVYSSTPAGTRATTPMGQATPTCSGVAPPTWTRFSKARSPAICRLSNQPSSSWSSTSRPRRRLAYGAPCKARQQGPTRGCADG